MINEIIYEQDVDTFLKISLVVVIMPLFSCVLYFFICKMKKRILKASAFCLAVVLIVGVCWFANGLVGNPASKMMAGSVAKKYLETNYPNTDYEVQEVAYSFKDGGYYAHVVTPSRISP